MSRRVKELDRALSAGTAPSDEELARMVEMGDQIRDAYEGFTPPHSAERAMFIRAVTDGASDHGWSRFLAPVTVTAVLLLGVLLVGRTSLPGDTLYPVREVLRNVGLAPASIEEIQTFLDDADRLLDRAEIIVADNPEAAERFAFEATRVLGMAEGAIDELEVDEQAQVTEELEEHLARAEAILTEGPNEDADRDADGRAANKSRSNRAKNNGKKTSRANGAASQNRSKDRRPARTRQRAGNRSTDNPGTDRRRTSDSGRAKSEDGTTSEDTSVGDQHRTTPDQDQRGADSTKDRVEKAVDLDELDELKAKSKPRG